MTSYLSYLWQGSTKNSTHVELPKTQYDLFDVTVAVAESVTAGALANSLCSEPGASKYFKGAIISYSKESNKEILGIDVKYAENNNFANPFTTAEMAKKAANMFKARIGLSTTGYSLPMHRPENKEENECELLIENPYAYICLYDRFTNKEIIIKVNFEFDKTKNKTIERANVQAKVALKAHNIYLEYVKRIKSEAAKKINETPPPVPPMIQYTIDNNKPPIPESS